VHTDIENNSLWSEFVLFKFTDFFRLQHATLHSEVKQKGGIIGPL